MASSIQVSFQVDDITVTIVTEDGVVVGVYAVDSQGNPYELGFAMGRGPIEGGGCEICRWIAGRKVCWQIDCRVMEPPAPEEKEVC